MPLIFMFVFIRSVEETENHGASKNSRDSPDVHVVADTPFLPFARKQWEPKLTEGRNSAPLLLNTREG